MRHSTSCCKGGIPMQSGHFPISPVSVETHARFVPKMKLSFFNFDFYPLRANPNILFTPELMQTLPRPNTSVSL